MTVQIFSRVGAFVPQASPSYPMTLRRASCAISAVTTMQMALSAAERSGHVDTPL
jgi:hypothetical protein